MMYHQIIGLLRCLLHFSLLQSAIMCIGALDLPWADLWVNSAMIPLTVQSNLRGWLLHLTIPTVLYIWFHVVSLFYVYLCVNCMHYSSMLKFHKLYLYCAHMPTATESLHSCRYAYKPFQCFKLAGIPGPKPRPITGNLGLVQQFDVRFHLSRCSKEVFSFSWRTTHESDLASPASSFHFYDSITWLDNGLGYVRLRTTHVAQTPFQPSLPMMS